MTFNPLDEMRRVAEEEGQQLPKKKAPRFHSGLEGAGKEVFLAQIKDSKRAGDYIRHTFTWTEDQYWMLHQIKGNEGFSSLNDAARWLMDQGIAAYVEEEARPERVQQERPEPKLREW